MKVPNITDSSKIYPTFSWDVLKVNWHTRKVEIFCSGALAKFGALAAGASIFLSGMLSWGLLAFGVVLFAQGILFLGTSLFTKPADFTDQRTLLAVNPQFAALTGRKLTSIAELNHRPEIHNIVFEILQAAYNNDAAALKRSFWCLQDEDSWKRYVAPIAEAALKVADKEVIGILDDYILHPDRMHR